MKTIISGVLNVPKREGRREDARDNWIQKRDRL